MVGDDVIDVGFNVGDDVLDNNLRDDALFTFAVEYSSKKKKNGALVLDDKIYNWST